MGASFDPLRARVDVTAVIHPFSAKEVKNSDDHLNAVIVNCMYMAEQNAKKAHEVVEKVHEKINLITNTLSKIEEATSTDGSLDISDNPNLQESFIKLRELGVKIPEQAHFSKDEKEQLVEMVKRKEKAFEADLTLAHQEAKRLLAKFDEFLKMAMSVQDLIHDLIMKIIARIAKSH